MLPLYDVTEQTGGLEVVPKSNTKKYQDMLRERHPGLGGMGDFCPILPRNPVVTENGRKLLLAKAGDFILWDSRTIHGGLVGKGGMARDPPRLARLTQTICMVPKSTATSEVLEGRRSGFESGYGFSHWPNETHVTAHSGPDYKPITPTPEQLELLG